MRIEKIRSGKRRLPESGTAGLADPGRRSQAFPVSATKRGRKGTTLVELALVLPVFLVFLGAIIEFGHAFMVSSTLHNAVKVAARDGVSGTMTSEEVKLAVVDKLDGIVDTTNLTVMVKDASILATAAGQEGVDIGSLPDLALDTAPMTQLYLVRVEIAYSDVALMAPIWVQGINLSGQAVMRRE